MQIAEKHLKNENGKLNPENKNQSKIFPLAVTILTREYNPQDKDMEKKLANSNYFFAGKCLV